MFQSKKTFLAARHTNTFDQNAQRALGYLAKLNTLQANAYDRGDGAGFDACLRAKNAAVVAFAIAHRERRYGFATDIIDTIDVIARNVVTINAEEDCGTIVSGLADAVAYLTERLPGVCTISGGGVVILRGDHVSAAMRDIVAHNDNRKAA